MARTLLKFEHLPAALNWERTRAHWWAQQGYIRYANDCYRRAEALERRLFEGPEVE